MRGNAFHIFLERKRRYIWVILEGFPPPKNSRNPNHSLKALSWTRPSAGINTSTQNKAQWLHKSEYPTLFNRLPRFQFLNLRSESTEKMSNFGAILKHPDDIYPMLKLKMAVRQAEKQIPPEPHWAFCYTLLHKVSRSFGLVVQQLGTELRNAVSFLFLQILWKR